MSVHADEISRLSLSLFHLLRDLARQDPAEAAMYFGVSEEVARAVADSSVTDLQALARPGIMFFVPRVRSSQLRQLCAEPGAPLEQARTIAMALAG